MCSLTGVSIGVLFAGLVVTQLQIHGLVPVYVKSEKTEILHIIDEKMKQSSNCEVTKTDESGQVVFPLKYFRYHKLRFHWHLQGWFLFSYLRCSMSSEGIFTCLLAENVTRCHSQEPKSFVRPKT